MELAILPDGSVFLLGDDQRWHHIPDVATANALGIDWNTLPSYDELPGEVGDPLPSLATASSAAQPAAQQPTAASAPVAPAPVGPLAGLLGDRSVYLAGDDGQWHWIPDVDTFNAMGLDWGAIVWYGELPGSIGDPLPSVTVASPTPVSQPTATATPFERQPTSTGTAAAPSYTGAVTGAIAGLISTREVFVAGDDGQWHHIPDVATANAMGIDWGAIAWYGELPGTIGDPLPSRAGQPAAPQQPATGQTAPTFTGTTTGAIAGLIGTGQVFVAGDDGQWHHISDVATANAMGIDWGTITWYGELPGTVGDPLPRVHPPPASADAPLPGTTHPIQPSANGTSIPRDSEQSREIGATRVLSSAGGGDQLRRPREISLSLASPAVTVRGQVKVSIDVVALRLDKEFTGGEIYIRVDGQLRKHHLIAAGTGPFTFFVYVFPGQTVRAAADLHYSKQPAPNRGRQSTEELFSAARGGFIKQTPPWTPPDLSTKHVSESGTVVDDHGILVLRYR